MHVAVLRGAMFAKRQEEEGEGIVIILVHLDTNVQLCSKFPVNFNI